MEVRDLEGNVVHEGDLIAGAFRIGNKAVLRTGRVLGFGERGNKLTVRVRWQYDSSSRGGILDKQIIGEIEADLDRFVKLGN